MKRTLVRLGSFFGLYLFLEWFFAYVTRSAGLVTPRGASHHLDLFAIGAVYLIARMVVRFLLAPILAYRLAMTASGIWRSRARVGGPLA